ncbi:MAG: zinc-binding dehydrogenase [Deltaproteobacteria bacterium]|nr:zinc-binding dehydrogenase [Deltaproteobacteria bacterium]
MAKTMQALVYDRRVDVWESSRGLRREEVEAPTLDESRDHRDAEMVLLETRFAGFCGSDRGIWFRRAFKDMIYDSLDREKKDVRIIGHELFGRVVAVGSRAARDFGLQPGDVTTTESHIICWTCHQCRHGDNHVCVDNKIIGISQDGCFADLVKLPASVLWRVDPRKIRPEVAALQEPFGNAVHACTKVNLRGKTVAIIGCGTIGLFAVLVARALGAHKVIGIEPVARHAEIARELGADAVIVPKLTDVDQFEHDPGLAREVRGITGGVGVDVAMEMSGTNASLNNAIAIVRRGGDVILFGLKSGDAVIEDFDRVIIDGISLHSVVGRRIWETWHITKNLLESRDPNIHDLVYDVILNRGQGTICPFRSFDAASFEKQIQTYPKVVLKFEE